MKKTSTEPTYKYLNSLEFVWDGYEWTIPSLGPSWLMLLANHFYRFHFNHYEEFGLFSGWPAKHYEPDSYTPITRDESGILRGVKYGQFEPYIQDCIRYRDLHFLRNWLDSWIDYECYLIANHIDYVLRTRCNKKEAEASKIADNMMRSVQKNFT